MYRGTKDIMLPTTITGSLPRPSWYTENLGSRMFLDAMVRRRYREQYIDTLSCYLREQELAGLDIVTDGDCRFDDDVGGQSWTSYPPHHMSGYERGDPRPTPAGRGGLWFPRGHILHDYLESRVMPVIVGPIGRGDLQYTVLWKAAQRMTRKPVKFGAVSAEIVAFASQDRYYKSVPERMLAIANGKVSMYDTDLFTDITAALDTQRAQDRLGAEGSIARVRRNIIADHARAVTFLINDGIFPSNTDRGYVLRFLIRRAVRNGRLLGYQSGFLTALVPAVVASLASGYPELREHHERISRTLAQEETSFERTLERGTAMLAELLDTAASKSETVLRGADVFTLHDTYGFPMELTREIAAERGIAVDDAGFRAAMEEQRARARADAERRRGVVALAELPAVTTEFTGYEGLESEGEIVALLRDEKSVAGLTAGERGGVILDRTSFYAERGGQIGDRGTIVHDDFLFDVEDSRYMGDAVVHYGVMKSGDAVVGQRVRSAVYDWWRREIRRHHTSAHLLQRALKDVLGEDVTQAGSWVGVDRMRFDFRWPAGGLTPQQRRAIVQRVNEMIRDDSHLVTRDLPVEEAKKTGAIWMFGEKYGERVRVVQAGPSIEFCGGTHSHSTGELGLFLITSEFSIGSGIRRIESCVSAAAESYVQRQQELVGDLASSLSTTPDELGERVSKLQRDVSDLQTAVGQLRARLAAADAQTYVQQAERTGSRTFVGAVVHEANGESLRHLSQAIRTQLPSGVIALAGIDDGAVSLLVSASDDHVKGGVHAGNLVKLAAPLVGGKGGGQAAQAQGGGRDPNGADAALRAIRDAVLS